MATLYAIQNAQNSLRLFYGIFRLEKFIKLLLKTKKLFLFCLAIFSCSVLIADDINPVYVTPVIRAEGDVIVYNGALNPEGTRLVTELIRSKRYKTLEIYSRGGEILSAMEFGLSVYEHEMDVVIPGLCLSSCANYIFPAGRNKKIDEGAFVMWHGDARQKNFIENFHQLEAKQKLMGEANMTERDVKMLLSHIKSVNTQDEFYSQLVIDGSIARIGQESRNRVSLWTMPASSMNRFGIKNIDAPANYGTEEYCKKWSGIYTFKTKITCLQLKDEYIEEWRSSQLISQPRLQ